MSFINDINQKKNVYIDQENLVEYLFYGWDRVLSVDEKLAFIAADPHVRQNPIGILFENDLVTISNPQPHIEVKIIYRAKVEEVDADPDQSSQAQA